MKNVGGTFSRYKSVLCAEEITVVGHRCTYEGRRPEEHRIKIIRDWGPCKDVSDVHAFLGTVKVCRVFIKNFAKLMEPLEKLKRLNVPWEWGPDQDDSLKSL